MNLRETLGLAALRHFDPEIAHTLALKALRSGLVTLPGPTTGDRLKTTLAGLSLANPVGLAAGFDKNATAVAPLSRAGFGFIELGAATPRPQPGNPKPRLFRLARDRAVINRFGFNNDGASEIAARLRAHTNTIPVGLNLGANKDSNDRAADYSSVLATTGAHIDFATVNVSSPNTASLRDLQGKAALTSLLNDVMATRNSLAKPIPVFLKIAPDLSLTQLGDIADVAQNARIDAIIATNTTLDHTHLTSTHANQTGGLSGAPLFDKSTRILAHLSHLTDGKIPLIGVGGIASGADAYAKIIAGADAVQLYTALVFQGLSLAANIARDLDDLLRRDGFSNVAQAVGTKRADWL